MQNNTTALDHSVLKRIRNLALFNDKQLNSLAARLEPKMAAPKQRIIGLGDLGDYSLYLLSGEAISRDGDGNERKMGSQTAAFSKQGPSIRMLNGCLFLFHSIDESR